MLARCCFCSVEFLNRQGVLDAAVVDIAERDELDIRLSLEIRRIPIPLSATADDADANLIVRALNGVVEVERRSSVGSRDGAGGGEGGFEEGAALNGLFHNLVSITRSLLTSLVNCSSFSFN